MKKMAAGHHAGLEIELFPRKPYFTVMVGDVMKDEIKEMMVESLMLKVPKEEIGDDTPLFGPEGLGLDSIDALELVVAIEKKFQVSVPNSDTARSALASVNSIHDYIIAQRGWTGSN